MKFDKVLRWIVFLGVVVGFVMLAYTCFVVPDGGPDAFTSGLFAFSILPYLACFAAVLKSARWQLMAACAIIPLLLLDSFAFNEAIIAPISSTSSLVLLVVPIINLVVLLLGFLVGWIAFALLGRNSRGNAP